MSRELLQQSLKLLIVYQDCTMDSYITNKCGSTIQAIESELAKLEQEPVAWLVSDAQGRYATIRDPAPYGEEVYEPLYAAPSRKPWVGLTNDEINDFAAGCHLGKSVQSAICQAAAKLKEKNNAL
jgi:hypothetical protein